MQINTNVNAMFARRSLDSIQSETRTSLQRLSSGLRINSAADDAAGLAIAERFTSEIRGGRQAVRNINDALSMGQTAEAALQNLSNDVQRIRELAVQAANATNSASDREALQSEVNQLLQNINQTSNNATFNGVKLFQGSGGSISQLSATEQAIIDGLRGFWLQQSESLIQQYFGLTGDGAELDIIIDDPGDGPNGTLAYVSGTGAAGGVLENLELHIDIDDFPINPPNGGTDPYYADRIIAHEMVHAVMARTVNFVDLANNHTWFSEGIAEFIHGADERLAIDLAAAGGDEDTVVAAINGAWTGSSLQYSSGYAAVRYMHDSIKANGGAGISDVTNYLSSNAGATLNDALANISGSTWANAGAFLTEFTAAGGAGATFLSNMDLSNEGTGAVGGFDADGGDVRSAETVVPNSGSYSDDPLAGFTELWDDRVDAFGSTGGEQFQFQVGTDKGQTIDITLGAFTAEALDLAAVNVADSAASAIVRADRALEYISAKRAEIGAYLNRFESASMSAQQSIESASASRSRIMDTDYATETATLVKNQIIQQAGQSMLVQANSQTGLVLQLLR